VLILNEDYEYIKFIIESSISEYCSICSEIDFLKN